MRLTTQDEWPGLAHFAEHGLFLGSRKYPAENEYNEYLSANGGTSNASTSLDETECVHDRRRFV